jgi:transcriptional regulator with XRE-family HTH domain
VSARHKITPFADHARLGAFLCSIRVEVGISQRELGKRLNLPQSFISKLERGERQLQVLELIAICEIFELEPTSFLKSFLELPLDSVPKIVRVNKKISKQ